MMMIMGGMHVTVRLCRSSAYRLSDAKDRYFPFKYRLPLFSIGSVHTSQPRVIIATLPWFFPLYTFATRLYAEHCPDSPVEASVDRIRYLSIFRYHQPHPPFNLSNRFTSTTNQSSIINNPIRYTHNVGT